MRFHRNIWMYNKCIGVEQTKTTKAGRLKSQDEELNARTNHFKSIQQFRKTGSLKSFSSIIYELRNYFLDQLQHLRYPSPIQELLTQQRPKYFFYIFTIFFNEYITIFIKDLTLDWATVSGKVSYSSCFSEISHVIVSAQRFLQKLTTTVHKT